MVEGGVVLSPVSNKETMMGRIPTVEVVGPGGKIGINEIDLKKYEAKGYKLVGSEDKPTPTSGDSGEESGGSNNDEEED